MNVTIFLDQQADDGSSFANQFRDMHSTALCLCSMNIWIIFNH